MVYEFYRSEELMHSGIKGQKWGVRRFQNEDRTWTAAGKIRYGSGNTQNRFTKTVGKFVSKARKTAEKNKAARDEKKQQRKVEKEKAEQAKKGAEEAKAEEKRKAEEAARAEEKRKADAQAAKKKEIADVARFKELRKKKAKDLTATEMAELTSRLNMEKAYKDLVKQTSEPKLFDAKKFAVSVLEDSGKKIAGKLLDSAVNNLLNKNNAGKVDQVGSIRNSIYEQLKGTPVGSDNYNNLLQQYVRISSVNKKEDKKS